MSRCNGVLTELLGGLDSELSSETDEASVVVGGIGVVHRSHQFGITSINAVAVVNQALLNRRNCRQGFDGGQWAKDLFGSRHRDLG